MDLFDDKNLSNSQLSYFHNDVTYTNFDFDSFFNSFNQETYLSTEELTLELSSRSQLHPTCTLSQPLLWPTDRSGLTLVRTHRDSPQALQFNHETSPFENSVLSSDNTESCFSWPDGGGFPEDADSLMRDNGSETFGTETTTSKTSPNYEVDRRRRPNLRFPRSAVQVLEDWLSQRYSCPYPTDRNKDELKKATGLKRSQISSWFANARKRGKVKPPTLSVIETVPEQPVLDLPGIENIHPFDRWRLAPLEYEACTPCAIQKAIATETHPLEPVIFEHYSSSKSRRSRATSVYSGYLGKTTNVSGSSLEIRPNQDISSPADTQSQHSLAFSEALVRRRRRRTLASSATSVNANPNLQSKRFQCTFCANFFARKHDWQRHEKSQHLPLESWTCSPSGSVNVNPITNEITCVFCDATDPTPEHIQEHGYGACIGRFPAERTFYRKDHLRQHLRLMHGNCAFMASMKSWNNTALAIRSRCGFCDAKFENWADRATHLAEHFGNGMTMAEWSGGWGLEPHVETILERATLPGIRAVILSSNEARPFATKSTQDSAQWSNYELPLLQSGRFEQDFAAFEGMQASTESFSLEMSPSNTTQRSIVNVNDVELHDFGLGSKVDYKRGLGDGW